jgi:hypothetical protein
MSRVLAERNQFQIFGVEPQRPVVIAVTFHRQTRADPAVFRAEIEFEIDGRHQPVGRAIIRAADFGGRRRCGGIEAVEHGRDLGAGRGGCNWKRYLPVERYSFAGSPQKQPKTRNGAPEKDDG